MDIPVIAEDEKLLQVNDALGELEAENPVEAQIVKMKYFMGMKADDPLEPGIYSATARLYPKLVNKQIIGEENHECSFSITVSRGGLGRARVERGAG